MLKKAPLFNQCEWDKFNTSLDDSGIQEMISSARKKGSNMLETVKKGLPRFPINRAYGGQVGIGSFANGGPVQYLRGGGPTKPRIKKFDRSTNEDTTITDTASKIGNFFSNLFSGGKSVDTGYGDLTKPGSAFPGSDLNFSEPPKIPTFEDKVNKQVPKINMDILDMPAPMDISSSPEAGGINMGILDLSLIHI